ncbi:MAG: hypothetical protein LBS60_08870 [Deltaproteobacteria bacterium]|jgi:hypothetical protein|nr:hypothetical protein [Deltaproteobacteria bacterium]
MIVKIYREQPELKVTLVQPGHLGRDVFLEEIKLIIEPPDPRKFAQLSPIIRLGDWGYPLPIEPYPPEHHRLPAIVYPAFDTDDEGAIIFRLDNHLWRRPSMRYVGHVMINSYEALTLDIDLEPMRYIPTKIELNAPKVCS